MRSSTRLAVRDHQRGAAVDQDGRLGLRLRRDRHTNGPAGTARGPYNFNLLIHQWPTRFREAASQVPPCAWLDQGKRATPSSCWWNTRLRRSTRRSRTPNPGGRSRRCCGSECRGGASAPAPVRAGGGEGGGPGAGRPQSPGRPQIAPGGSGGPQRDRPDGGHDQARTTYPRGRSRHDRQQGPLYDRDGRMVASSFTGYGMELQTNWSEQNPDYRWQAACASTRQLFAAAKVQPKAHRLYHLQRPDDGVPSSSIARSILLRNAPDRADMRAAAEAQTIIDGVGMEQADRITGHRASPLFRGRIFCGRATISPKSPSRRTSSFTPRISSSPG